MSLYQSHLVEFNSFLDRFISNNFEPTNLDKVKYMLDGGGKRIRPILGIAFNSSKDQWDLMAIVEIIHNTSLILDDTPQMDNDTIRRNMPAFHVKFGQLPTYLFAYYLVGWASKYLTARYAKLQLKKIDFQKFITDNVSQELLSLIQGQYKDLQWGKQDCPISDKYADKYASTMEVLNTALKCQRMEFLLALQYFMILVLEKTASLFWLPIMLANIDSFTNTANPDTLPSRKFIHQRWAYIFGVAFQISDDLLDIDQDLEHGKPNICTLMPVSSAKDLLIYLSDWLKSQLVELGTDINCELLAEIINMLSRR